MALAVQWKLALITMSIVPAIFVVIAACLGVNAPIEARIVSVHLRKNENEVLTMPLPRHGSTPARE